MRIYIASPLCSEAERDFNLKLDEFIRDLGVDTYLPQRDGGLLSDLVKQGLNEQEVRMHLFGADVSAMDTCGAIVANLDGRSIDEGVCFELGYMYARQKPCIAIKTDARTYIRGRINLMIEGPLLGMASSWGDLRELLLKLK